MSAIEKAKNYMKSGIRQSGLLIVPLALMAVHAEASSVTTYFNATNVNASVTPLNSGGNFFFLAPNFSITNGVAIGTLVRGTKVTGDGTFANDDTDCSNSGCQFEISAIGNVALDGVQAPGAYLKYDFNAVVQNIAASRFAITPQAVALSDFDWVITLSINSNQVFNDAGSATFGDSVNNGPVGDYFSIPTLNGFTDAFELRLLITPSNFGNFDSLVVTIPDNTLQIAGTRDQPGGNVPEPASMALVAAGIAALCYRRLRG